MKKLICGLAVCSFALVLSGCGKADKLTCTMDNEFMPMEMVMTFDGDEVSKVESVMIFEDEETAKAMYEVAKLSDDTEGLKLDGKKIITELDEEEYKEDLEGKSKEDIKKRLEEEGYTCK